MHEEGAEMQKANDGEMRTKMSMKMKSCGDDDGLIGWLRDGSVFGVEC